MPCPPHELLVGKGGSTSALGGADSLPDSAQVCSCNNVTKSQICTAIRDQNLESVAAVKACTRAGTGCGGCVPLVTDLFQAELKKAGKLVVNHLCEHFPLSRTELFAVVKIKELQDVRRGHLPLRWRQWLRDLQTGGDFDSGQPVEREHSGAGAPDAPGHQRPLFGQHAARQIVLSGSASPGRRNYARTTDRAGKRCAAVRSVHQDYRRATHRFVRGEGAGSSRASGRSWSRPASRADTPTARPLRTVKSCVGTTWCRYGVQDSVGFAIRVENRYKGIRAPHKIKMAVSGCVRDVPRRRARTWG